MNSRFYGYFTTICLIAAIAAALVSDYTVEYQWALRGIAIIAAGSSLGAYLYRRAGSKKT